MRTPTSSPSVAGGVIDEQFAAEVGSLIYVNLRLDGSGADRRDPFLRLLVVARAPGTGHRSID